MNEQPTLTPGPNRQRLDKWLFYARVVKSRTLAAKLANGGSVRINGEKAPNASRNVQVSDVVTITLARRILIYKVLHCGTRRGPATEARLLYEDMSPPVTARPVSILDRIGPMRDSGAGRPTKRERRLTDRLRGK